ncbi:MAG: LapA family protein [candidate division Zixibacteria bacterium]
MWAVRAILAALMIIVVVAFAYFNLSPSQTVDVNLIYVKYLGVPLVTVVFWSFVAGMVVSLILFISVYIRLSVQIRSSTKRINALEGEVAVLRNRPIEESADLLKGADEKHLEVKSPFTEGE